MDKKLIFAIAKTASEVRDLIPQAALYEQMAEECTELAKACLKKARKMRGENFTPIPEEEIDAAVNEEYADISLVAMTLGLKTDHKIMYKKCKRWVKRNTPTENTPTEENANAETEVH